LVKYRYFLGSAFLTATILAALACTRQGPKDLGNENKRSEFGVAGTGSPYASSEVRRNPDAGAGNGNGNGSTATAIPAGKKPKEIARANTRAMATNMTHLFYGDAEDDALFAIPKTGGDPVRVSRRSPIPGGLAFDSETSTLSWIATPGDTVFRVGVNGGTPTTVRDRGLFTDVATLGGDVFITEAQAGSGVVTRVTGNTAARLATIDGLPRGICVDAEHVYIATSTKLAMTSRTRGEVVELARGSSFSSPLVIGGKEKDGGGGVIATTTAENQSTSTRRIVVRAKKRTGLSGTETWSLETIATNVREAPTTVYKGIVYWFDADRPALLARAIATPAASPQVVSEDELFDRPSAITVDEDGIFIAAGYGANARIVSIGR